MLINAQRPDEVRIAIVNGNSLDSYEVAATDSGLCRGNIYRGNVANIQPSLDAAFVNFGVERDGLLRADDVVPQAYHRAQKSDSKHPRIDRILERNGEILVQVVRDAVGHKGALVTSNLSIAGRYLVLMPLDDVRGVSRKLEDEEDRNTIRERLTRLELPEGCGVIARTNAADQPQRSLNRDANALLRLWKKIRQEATTGKGPRLLYSDQDLIVQALRDSVDASIEEILVDDEAAFAKAQGFMQTFMPRSRAKLTPYKDRLPLFSRYELESQIEKIYLRKVDRWFHRHRRHRGSDRHRCQLRTGHPGRQSGGDRARHQHGGRERGCPPIADARHRWSGRCGFHRHADRKASPQRRKGHARRHEG